MATNVDAALHEVKNLRGGHWESSATKRWGTVYNPSRGEAIARVPMSTKAEVDATIETAADALPAWAETPVVDRARCMFRLRERLLRRFDELAATVTREHGKTLAESQASVQRAIEMIEFSCGIPSLIMGRSLDNVAREVDCETVRHPVGVCVGITPFNFPAMVPLWMAPVAITCGNTFVLKPSEKVPLTAVLLGELFLEAGVPEGVFNIVHGDRDAVDRLLEHPLVRAVSFVGSTEVARHVYATGTRHGKRVQAAGGAKNHLVILPDADLDQSVDALVASGYGCAGERCMAGSVAVPVGGIADPLVERLCERAEQLAVGPTDGGGAFEMGPLITEDHRKRVAGYLDIARDEGASIAFDGRDSVPRDGFFLRPSVLDRVAPDMRVAREEIFGPVLSVVRAGDLDAAIDVTRGLDYGNGASIFTRNGHAARAFKRHVNAGMVGINVGVPAPMAWFPFTGWNGSFFGDLHIQGVEGVQFYTRAKMTMTRWFAGADDSAADPVWKGHRPDDAE